MGPTTLAAPLAILKAKCFSGQAFEIPHLYLGGFVALGEKNLTKKMLTDSTISLFHISNHKEHYAKHQDINTLKYMLGFFFSPEGFKGTSK